MTRPILRPATPDDLPQITAIYGQSVETATASFELDPPDLAEMTARFERLTQAGFPYFVAERDGVVLGYAYAGPQHPRAAYRHTVEDSIYIAENARGQSLGKQLLAQLIDACEALDHRLMIAIISESSTSAASIGLHERFGFMRVGTMRGAGWKFDHWIDVHYLQRPLGVGTAMPPADVI